MQDLSQYDINQVLRQNIDLKRLLIMDYFFNNPEELTKYNYQGKEYILFSPNFVTEYATELGFLPSNLLIVMKMLQKEGFLTLISGHFNCPKHGYLRSACKLNNKFFDLLKK